MTKTSHLKSTLSACLLASLTALSALASDFRHTDPSPIFSSRPSSEHFFAECGMLDTMIFRINIGIDGSVKAEVLRGTGCDFADREIRRCVESWCYEPAKLEGKPIEAEKSFVINWGYPNFEDPPSTDIYRYCQRATELWAGDVTEGQPCAPVFRKAIETGQLPTREDRPAEACSGKHH